MNHPGVLDYEANEVKSEQANVLSRVQRERLIADRQQGQQPRRGQQPRLLHHREDIQANRPTQADA